MGNGRDRYFRTARHQHRPLLGKNGDPCEQYRAPPGPLQSVTLRQQSSSQCRATCERDGQADVQIDTPRPQAGVSEFGADHTGSRVAPRGRPSAGQVSDAAVTPKAHQANPPANSMSPMLTTFARG